ncbi:DUF2845 domain-containing protein [Pseudomonas japonica]|uniref:DUF2845 domain-containing protein n=1 Tax=Pseudomonas japonica TaxID=256466 RepID=UPI0015E42753|nr:DUF2845 domain-containing protein [Pseudomonas japonica]MBA1289538.1 DUF2845 domain-containing protein [Pseudomonas japonica]
MKPSLSLLASALLFCASFAWADDTLRCNSALISVHDRMGEVLRKCGEPTSRSPQGSVRVSAGAGRRLELPVEEWTYGPNSGMYHYLRFEGDELVRITGDRG